MVLDTNGLCDESNLKESTPYLLKGIYALYQGDADFEEIKARLISRFSELWKSGTNQLSANDFLSHACDAIFEKPEGTAVIKMQREYRQAPRSQNPSVNKPQLLIRFD